MREIVKVMVTVRTARSGAVLANASRLQMKARVVVAV
jgi:hypothetical protein